MMCHISKSSADVSVTHECLKWPWVPLCYWNNQLHQALVLASSTRQKGPWVGFLCLLGWWLVGSGCVKTREPQGSEAPHLWVRAEIKGRREVLWQYSVIPSSFLPFPVQALVLIPTWTMQKTLCFGLKACVGMTNFLPARLWRSQRTQCRKYHQWTPSPL